MHDLSPDREQWNLRYRQASAEPGQPAPVLWENRHLLPAAGTALDLACGLGANALLLAELGLKVDAWDIADVAIDRLRAAARQRGFNIHAQARDVVRYPPLPATFDVIVVSFFLERSLAPHLMSALRPNGLLFYQTYTRTRVDQSGPRNDAYRLADNELLKLFSPLQLLVYREEGADGDPSRGFRNQAMLVGKRAK